jgi:hypothetical protein
MSNIKIRTTKGNIFISEWLIKNRFIIILFSIIFNSIIFFVNYYDLKLLSIYLSNTIIQFIIVGLDFYFFINVIIFSFYEVLFDDEIDKEIIKGHDYFLELLNIKKEINLEVYNDNYSENEDSKVDQAIIEFELLLSKNSYIERSYHPKWYTVQNTLELIEAKKKNKIVYYFFKFSSPNDLISTIYFNERVMSRNKITYVFFVNLYFLLFCICSSYNYNLNYLVIASALFLTIFTVLNIYFLFDALESFIMHKYNHAISRINKFFVILFMLFSIYVCYDCINKIIEKKKIEINPAFYILVSGIDENE